MAAHQAPHPWDSPGKNTGVGCHFLSNPWKWKVKVKSLNRVRLLATPWTAAHQAPPSMGFSRQGYWSGVPLPSPLEALGLAKRSRMHICEGYSHCLSKIWIQSFDGSFTGPSMQPSINLTNMPKVFCLWEHKYKVIANNSWAKKVMPLNIARVWWKSKDIYSFSIVRFIWSCLQNCDCLIKNHSELLMSAYF